MAEVQMTAHVGSLRGATSRGMRMTSILKGIELHLEKLTIFSLALAAVIADSYWEGQGGGGGVDRVMVADSLNMEGVGLASSGSIRGLVALLPVLNPKPGIFVFPFDISTG